MLLDNALYSHGSVVGFPWYGDRYGDGIRPDTAGGRHQSYHRGIGYESGLITTIFGIIVALVLQVFYNYILSKIEHIVSQMEESAITLMDIIAKHKKSAGLAK